MNLSDVGVVPYDDNLLWNNALPAKLFEYCAAGLPVIATTNKKSLLSKIISENKIGLTVSPMNEHELSKVIYQLHQNKEFRIQAGRNARKLIETNYDRNIIAMDFLKLVSEAFHNSENTFKKENS